MTSRQAPASPPSINNRFYSSLYSSSMFILFFQRHLSRCIVPKRLAVLVAVLPMHLPPFQSLGIIHLVVILYPQSILHRAAVSIRIGYNFISAGFRSEEHTSELQSRENLVCRLLLEK